MNCTRHDKSVNQLTKMPNLISVNWLVWNPPKHQWQGISWYSNFRLLKAKFHHIVSYSDVCVCDRCLRVVLIFATYSVMTLPPRLLFVLQLAHSLTHSNNTVCVFAEQMLHFRLPSYIQRTARQINLNPDAPFPQFHDHTTSWCAHMKSITTTKTNKRNRETHRGDWISCRGS